MIASQVFDIIEGILHQTEDGAEVTGRCKKRLPGNAIRLDKTLGNSVRLGLLGLYIGEVLLRTGDQQRIGIAAAAARLMTNAFR